MNYFEDECYDIEDLEKKHFHDNCEYIEVEFDHYGHQGLFNKIIYLSGIVRHCLQHPNIRLVEPIYKIGVEHHTYNKEGILFSDIFDIDFFNNKMDSLFYIVPRKKCVEYGVQIQQMPQNFMSQFGWYIEHVEYINIASHMDKISIEDNILLKVMSALKLNKTNRDIIKKIMDELGENYNAFHIRTEHDWPQSWNKVTNSVLISLYRQSDIYDPSHNLFFSTGENHDEIESLFNQIHIASYTFSSSELLYDLKTAISYTICLLSNYFIGHSDSTFSSLITMQRELLHKNDNNYFYDSNGVYKRLDHGLHYKKNHFTHKNAGTNVDICTTLPEFNKTQEHESLDQFYKSLFF